MGIPNYFVQLIKTHSNIIKKFSKNSIEINNFQDLRVVAGWRFFLI